MADFNLPTFEQQIAARKSLGSGATAQAAVGGIEKGLSLAEIVRKRQMEEQQALMEQQQKKQELALKINQAVSENRKTEASLIPTSSLSTSAQKMLPGKTEVTPDVLKGLQPKEVPVAALSAIPQVDPKEVAKIAALYPSGMMPEAVFNTTSASLRKGITSPIAEQKKIGRQQQTLNNFIAGQSKNKILKDASIMVFQDDRLQALNDYAKGNPTDQEVHELTVTFDRILRGGGIPPVTEIENLLPTSAMASGSKMWQWLTAEPTGTNQQELIKRLVGGASRETEVARDNIKRELERLKINIHPEDAKDPAFMKKIEATILSQVSPEEYNSVKGHTTSKSGKEINKSTSLKDKWLKR